jgi:hypothetical protein
MACRQAVSSRGKLIKVTVTMDDDQMLDGDGVGRAQMARELTSAPVAIM